MSEHHHHHHESAVSSKEEALALLKYNAHHNGHHIEELQELAKQFPEEIQAMILNAADLMRQGNAVLEEACRKAEE